MQGAYAEADGWIVDVDDNTTDGSLVVTIRTRLLYVDFWCRGPEVLGAAASFIRSPSADGTLRIGSFCNDLFIELDCYSEEPEAIYLSATRPDEQSMAYCLRDKDRKALAAALNEVAVALAKKVERDAES